MIRPERGQEAAAAATRSVRGTCRGVLNADSGTRVILGGALLLVALGVAATHWPALTVRATLFDDEEHVTENVLVQNPSCSSVQRFFGEVLKPSVGGYYKPLAMTSLMLDRALARDADDLRPFRRTSLALHVANTVLVILLLHALFHQPWVAALVGLLFGVHPLTVEAIPWAAERKNLLAAFFALACLTLYVRHARRGSRPAYAAALGMFLLALLSKPTAVPLPALLVILDWWPLRRLNRRAIVEKLPFFAVAGLAAYVTWKSQTQAAGAEMPGEYPLAQIPLVVSHNIIFYLSKIVWPARLSIFYPYPEPLSLGHPAVLAGVVGTVLLLGGTLVSLRWSRIVGASGAFFLLAILPTLGVVRFTGAVAADRFAYLPAVGALLGLTAGLARAWGRPTVRPGIGLRRTAVLAAAVGVAAAEALATRQYLADWKTSETLFRHAVVLAPNVPQLRVDLGESLASQGRFDEAIEQYQAALDMWPDYAPAHNNLGSALARSGRPEEALPHFKHALRVRPGYPEAHNNLGNTLMQLGRRDEAIEHYRAAIRCRPDYVPAYYNLGRAYEAQNRLKDAADKYRQVLRLRPDHAGARERLSALRGGPGQSSGVP